MIYAGDRYRRSTARISGLSLVIVNYQRLRGDSKGWWFESTRGEWNLDGRGPCRDDAAVLADGDKRPVLNAVLDRFGDAEHDHSDNDLAAVYELLLPPHDT